MDYKEIELLFTGLVESINDMIQTDLYTEKELINQIKEKVENWFDSFKNSKSLTKIKLEDIKFLDLEIIDLQDKYIMIEPVLENYIERTSYNFGILEKAWKDEMLGGNKNVW